MLCCGPPGWLILREQVSSREERTCVSEWDEWEREHVTEKCGGYVCVGGPTGIYRMWCNYTITRPTKSNWVTINLQSNCSRCNLLEFRNWIPISDDSEVMGSREDPWLVVDSKPQTAYRYQTQAAKVLEECGKAPKIFRFESPGHWILGDSSDP